MMTPKISVIMPVYNAEQYINEAITGILKQTYSSFEFIIVDDCSTDNTSLILEEFQRRDQRIKLVKNEYNQKQAYSRNRAINLAKGKYVAFIDADDIAYPSRLQTQLNFMEQNPNIDVCGSYYYLFNGRGLKFKQNPPITHDEIQCFMRIFGNAIGFSTVFAKSYLIKQYLFDAKMLGNAEDYELWLRMLSNGAQFHNIPQYLVFYRVHPQQTSHKNASQMYHLANQMRKISLMQFFPMWRDNEIYNAIICLGNTKPNIKMFNYWLLLNKIKRRNSRIKLFNQDVLTQVIGMISIKNRAIVKLQYLILRLTAKK